MHQLFVYLLELYNGSPNAFLYFTALCTSKGDIRASTLCSLWKFSLVHYYVGRPSQAFLTASVTFPIAFISLFCTILSANDSEVDDYGDEHTLLWPLTFLQVSSDHSCCGSGLPVPKLGIINQSNILHDSMYRCLVT